MIHVRRSQERGHANHGWLDSYHTFSFADYYDPKYMGFSDLRVINEDRIQGGAGFPTHPHRDMEILTYIISGALAHRDTLGNEEVIRAGEVQRMSAGTGVRHSEFNASATEPVHLLQIWILPEANGIPPGYEQKNFTSRLTSSPLLLVASRDGREDSVSLHQNVDLYVARWARPHAMDFQLKPDRKAWIQVIDGAVELGSHVLGAGDGAAVADETALRLNSASGAHFLLFDLPR